MALFAEQRLGARKKTSTAGEENEYCFPAAAKDLLSWSAGNDERGFQVTIGFALFLWLNFSEN